MGSNYPPWVQSLLSLYDCFGFINTTLITIIDIVYIFKKLKLNWNSPFIIRIFHEILPPNMHRIKFIPLKVFLVTVNWNTDIKIINID